MLKSELLNKNVFENTAIISISKYEDDLYSMEKWCYTNIGRPAEFIETVNDERRWCTNFGYIYGSPNVILFKFYREEDYFHFVLRWIE